MKKIPTPALILTIVIAFVLSMSPVAGTNHGSSELASALAAGTSESSQATDSMATSETPAAAPQVVASAEMLGYSGRLRAVTGTSEALEQNPLLQPLPGSNATAGDASWPKLPTAEGDSFTVVTLVPISDADRA